MRTNGAGIAKTDLPHLPYLFIKHTNIKIAEMEGPAYYSWRINQCSD